MPWVPVVSVEVVITAWEVSLPVDVTVIGVAGKKVLVNSSKSWIVPVGAPLPPDESVTVNVTESPTVLGFFEDTIDSVTAICACAANAGSRNAPARSATVPIDRQ